MKPETQAFYQAMLLGVCFGMEIAWAIQIFTR